MMKIFGCRVWTLKHDAKKLESQAEKCIYLGVQNDMKGYRLWSERKKGIIFARSVVFQEDKLPYLKKKEKLKTHEKRERIYSVTEETGDSDENGEINEEQEDTEKENPENDQEKLDTEGSDTEKNENENQELAVQIPNREDRLLDEQNTEETNPEENTAAGEDILRRSRIIPKPTKNCICCNLVTCKKTEPTEPMTYQEAIEGIYSKEWIESMKEKIENMNRNEAW